MNKNKALESFKIYGRSDVGQSMIIQNNIILGLESVEGTNELINRSFNYNPAIFINSFYIGIIFINLTMGHIICIILFCFGLYLFSIKNIW